MNNGDTYNEDDFDILEIIDIKFTAILKCKVPAEWRKGFINNYFACTV
jgi:hypothetical protein